MVQAKAFLSACISRGYTFLSGVPCSFLKPLINCVISHDGLDYIGASSEGEAVGIASGVYLAGRKAVVMCQNSGLGNAVNPITSLNYPFRIPLLLIITLRGEPGLKDEPQHELMGRITGNLLDTLKVPWEFFPETLEEVNNVFERAGKKMAKEGFPYALVMKRGSVVGDNGRDRPGRASFSMAHPGGVFACPLTERMGRMEAIRILKDGFPKPWALIATTGKIGRELFTAGDDTNHFYVVGSMGCAAGIGLGLQYVRPRQGVVVFDGDGAALMKMGTLATIGYHQPKGLVHVILDNESYESTGGQGTVSPSVDFCTIASGCGYRKCYRADTYSKLANAIEVARDFTGPSLIHVKVAPGSEANLGRPTVTPVKVKNRFMKFLNHQPAE